MGMKKSGLGMVLMILLVLGGLHLGVLGIFEYDVVAELLGEMTTASRVVYSLVGVSALYALAMAFSDKE